MLRFGHILIACWLAVTPGRSATYHVDPSGNDANPGTAQQPWRTIGKAATTLVAGDTVIIGNGDYDEHVHETTPGTEGQYITFKAANQGMASLRAFRISAPFINLDGLTFSNYSNIANTWNAAVRIERSGSHSIVQNCTWTGYPYIIAHDFQFDSTHNKILSQSSDFITAGFRKGSKIYLGASGATVNGVPLFYENHDTSWTVDSVSRSSMILAGAAMKPDSGSDYWVFLRAGATHGGNAAIQCVMTSGQGAQSVTIRSNKFISWAAHVLDIAGDGHLIENNEFQNLLSFRFCQFRGSNHIFRRNIIKNCKNVVHYSAADMKTIEHPEGTGWYDYQVSMFSAWNARNSLNNNILIEENWFENIENQLGRADSMGAEEGGEAQRITYRRNVFIGVSQQFSGGRPGMQWINNTFYKCVGFHNGQAPAHPLSIGARPADVAQTGYEIKGNMFVACGPMGIPATQTRGYYTVADWVVDPIIDYNFVTSEEVTGYIKKSNFKEANGITGGDPLFVDPLDPDGPDDIPFTEDDGLKVLPHSPAAAFGGGALGVAKLANSQPYAHFRLTSPNGWFEGTGEAYDPNWIKTLPTKRSDTARPYQNPVAIGTAPLRATFSGDNSVSSVNGEATNSKIIDYTWNFGDGSPTVISNSSSISHIFTSPGDVIVTLSVRNSLGEIDSFSAKYRILGVRPSAPKNIRVK